MVMPDKYVVILPKTFMVIVIFKCSSINNLLIASPSSWGFGEMLCQGVLSMVARKHQRGADSNVGPEYSPEGQSTFQSC